MAAARTSKDWWDPLGRAKQRDLYLFLLPTDPRGKPIPFGTEQQGPQHVSADGGGREAACCGRDGRTEAGSLPRELRPPEKDAHWHQRGVSTPTKKQRERRKVVVAAASLSGSRASPTTPTKQHEVELEESDSEPGPSVSINSCNILPVVTPRTADDLM
ncbi:hypothetical protein NDU88_001265 [Pleurodeles waltl]|uniref:Uncharacterized protein n=1 Tax=Pleurodeles waltl TaxID=8319 RepID=A0AAV7L930_PLEWA|nr:hypothetical protein NDU88_001265 [Pleurodeles waltl]